MATTMTVREAIMAALKRYDGGQVVFYSEADGKGRVGAVTLPSPAFPTIVQDEDDNDKWAVCGDIPPTGQCGGGTIRSARLFNAEMQQTQPLGVGVTGSGGYIEVESLEIEHGGPIHITSISCDLDPPIASVPKVLRGIMAEDAPEPGIMGTAEVTRAAGNHWLDSDKWTDAEKQKYLADGERPDGWKFYEPEFSHESQGECPNCGADIWAGEYGDLSCSMCNASISNLGGRPTP